MHATLAFFARTLGRLLRWSLALLMGLVVAGFLLLGLGVALLWAVGSLVRGKRPALFSVFQGFQQMSRRFGQRAAGVPAASQGDVVDVQAHEVRQVLPGRDRGDRP
jgi:hypothetical protein